MDTAFLPSTPPAHKDNCKSELSAHAHEEREYFERAELENMFNFGVEERDHQREMFFQDLEKHPQEIDFCRFHNIRRGKNWHVNLQEEHWNMDPSSESEGSSALDDEVKTQRPETLSLQSGARRTEEMKVEHGEYPWRHTLQNDDDAKYVTVTIAEVQVMAEVDQGPEHTVMSANVWAKYLQVARETDLEISDYEAYQRMSRRERKSMRKCIMVDGRVMKTHGPFNCWVRLDSTSIKLPVYVTADVRMGRLFAPGRDLWVTLGVKVCRASDSDHEAQIWVDKEGEQYNALLDTGAGPNIITYDAFRRMGYEQKQIEATTTVLSMADNTRMEVIGKADIEINILQQRLQLPCIVVRDLGKEDLVLGRSFFRKYDVILDIGQRLITIRNVEARYQIIEGYKERTPAHQQRAVLAVKASIPASQISVVKCDVLPRARALRGVAAHQKGTWLAMTEREKGVTLQNKGVASPQALVMVREGTVHLPFLNVREKGGRTAKVAKGMGTVIVKPVNRTYTREYMEPPGDQDAPILHVKVAVDGTAIQMTHREFDETKSVITSLHNSEPPITIQSKKPTQFVTKPPTEHLKEFMGEEHQEELRALLEEYKEIFSKDKTDIGCAVGVEHDIELLPEAKPFRDPYRRFIPAKKEAVDEQVDALLKDDICEESKSPYSSAVVLVKKGDGTWRFCVDFRKLNAITKKDAYPLPRIDETLEKMGNALYFTSLDMGSAFWQIELTKRAKELTAFVTSKGQFQWNRMPFGLCNATATFQRMMTKILAGLSLHYGNVVLCYVDDILIASHTIEEHLIRLREVFSALSKAGLKLKAAKCRLFDREIRFLGRKISGAGIEPDPDKIKPVQEWIEPRNKKELASYLGFRGVLPRVHQGFRKESGPAERIEATLQRMEMGSRGTRSL